MTTLMFDSDADELRYLYEIATWPLDERRHLTIDEIEDRIAAIEADYGIGVSS